MNGNMRVHGHYNGLKTTMLFALMWGIIMLIWWLTGAQQATLSIYLLIGIGMTFISYWFSDKIAIASMHAKEVSEQEAPQLYRIVRELSARAGKPMPRIYIAPTQSPNAFATGRNERNAAVCCTEGLMGMLNERELRGVLGHELMHVYNRDILTSAIASANTPVVVPASMNTVPEGGSSCTAARAIARLAPRAAFDLVASVVKSVRKFCTGTAPPWTRKSSPPSSRTARSRRIVSAVTPNFSANSFTVTLP